MATTANFISYNPDIFTTTELILVYLLLRASSKILIGY